MTIEVTIDDIDYGVTHDVERCPVALAVRRAGLHDARVYGEYIEIGDKRISHSYEVFDFIASFDADIPVQPFCFEMSEAPTC